MSLKPRLLVVTPDYPPSPGGIQLLMQRLAEGVTGFETRVVTLSPSEAAADTSDAVHVRRVARPRGGQMAAVAAMSARAIADAVRFRPDVVLCGHVVASPAAFAVRRLTGAPVLLYLHAAELGLRRGLSRFGVSRADLNVAVSRHTRELALGLGAPSERVRLISPGVDLPPDAERNEDAEPIVVTVASLDYRYKGHDVLCRALPLVSARVPGVRWVVIGDGSLRAHLEHLARANGVNGEASFLGRVDDAERDEWLRRASVFAMPSRLPPDGAGGEGFGIAFMEASSHGLPVVAGAVGGALDAVVHGETGLLVDPTDHVSVADAIATLLLDRDRARALGEGGVRRACEFSWARATGSLEAALLELTARPR
jgi:phosphatidylinositol alpha-1,6-mannosyltransferase